MSTRSSIAYSEKYHLYAEVFDDTGLYLEQDGNDLEFEVYPNRINVKIPNQVLKAILDNAEQIRKHIESDRAHR